MLRISKVNIVDLISTLSELRSIGVEYVDISGEEGQNVIALLFTKDYMLQGYENTFDDIQHEHKKKLTDDDINQLI